MFAGADNFTGDLSTWDVRRASNMEGMFDFTDYDLSTLCGFYWVTSIIAQNEFILDDDDNVTGTKFPALNSNGICRCPVATFYQEFLIEDETRILLEYCFPCPPSTYSLGGRTRSQSGQLILRACPDCATLENEYYCAGSERDDCESRVFLPVCSTSANFDLRHHFNSCT